MPTTLSLRTRRMCPWVLYAALILITVLAPCGTLAQSESASVSGRVTDQQNAVIPNVEVEIRNVDTNFTEITKTNGDGIYTFPSLRPGNYVMSVRKEQFQTVSVTGISLHVQDSVSRNFVLQVGSSAVSITVTADGINMNTTDGSVSTVVDRTFVENTPLNGRSFQDLILLTPGTVTANPNSAQNVGAQGEFSVNGQRTEANYYTVDGVGANLSVSPGQATAGNSGSTAAATALGTTQALVSVDALQEFRVQSSTYSAEYGRNPGGQFSFVTRSGTNEWHGTLFDYIRNNIFDANDWFNNYFGLPEPAERQNDFGGTLGAPIRIPGLYDGKDKTFFFASYEGLRLRQPQPSSIANVPTSGATGLRTQAPSALQPILNAFPVPFCPASASPGSCSTDLGNGLGDFIGTWSNPASIDAFSLRLDQAMGQRVRIFFRFSNTPSDISARNTAAPSVVSVTSETNQTYTIGVTSVLSNRINNESRLNYSTYETTAANRIDNFGGAQSVDIAKLQGLNTSLIPTYSIQFNFFGDQAPLLQQGVQSGNLHQSNFVDTVAVMMGRHQFKFGADYRRLASFVGQKEPFIFYDYFTENSVLANASNFARATSNARAYPVYTNFSAFAQDTWRLTPHLSLDMGLRWEVNPAPGVTSGSPPYTVQGLDNLATATLAPQGTPLWHTGWHNLAPRLGAAYILHSGPGFETLVRGGAGIFYDTGQQAGSLGFTGPGYVGSSGLKFGQAFPFAGFAPGPEIVNPPQAPYSVTAFAFAPNLQLPWTLQTNLSVQQALGKSQSLTISYVGAFGRKLLERNFLVASNVNVSFLDDIYLVQNGLSSDYNALQLQFQRRLSRGLQVLASYTTSHCIDYGSQNDAIGYVRGNCDFDVRHNFASAISYEVPNVFRSAFARSVFHHWRLDDRLTARSAFPVQLNGPCFPNATTQQQECAGFNIVAGKPFYISGSQCAAVYANGLGCPGGRAINPNALSLPPGCTFFSCVPGTMSGDLPRNFARGFGAWQMDFAVGRDFPIHERLKLQFRAEAFNVFNHPNFGAIDNAPYCVPNPSNGCLFGQSFRTLASSLSVMNSLYQMGGPRSMQFALKLEF